jgi:hypothetical protein
MPDERAFALATLLVGGAVHEPHCGDCVGAEAAMRESESRQ